MKRREDIPAVIKRPQVVPSLNITPSELRIVALYAQGLNKEEIAKFLFNSRHTIKKHTRNLREKIGVNNMTQIVVYCLAHGFLKFEGEDSET